MRRLAGLLLVVALLATLPARAETLDKAGAETLKKQLESELYGRADMGKSTAADNAITVTPGDGFYEARIPHLYILTGREGRLDAGPLRLKATPAPGNAWRLEATLPPMMNYTDRTGQRRATVTVESHTITGTWWPERAMVTDAKALLKNISAKGANANDLQGRIDSVHATAGLKDNGDGTWSGPVDVDVSGLTLGMPGENMPGISVGRILAHSLYERLDMSHAMAARKEIRAAADKGALDSEEGRRALLKKILAAPPVSTQSAENSVEIHGFRLHDKDSAPGQSPHEVAFERAFFSSTTAPAAGDNSKITAKTDIGGLRITFVQPLLADFVPHTVAAAVTLDNVPLKKITAQFFALMQKAADTPNTPEGKAQVEKEMDVIADSIPHLFQEAGSTASIDSAMLKSNALETTIKGSLKADAADAMLADGKIFITLKGLDEALQKLQASALKGGNAQVFGYIGGLALLQTRGTPGTAADGVSLRDYIFELTREGRILLNGQTFVPAQSTAPPSEPKKPAVPAPEKEPAKKI